MFELSVEAEASKYPFWENFLVFSEEKRFKSSTILLGWIAVSKKVQQV